MKLHVLIALFFGIIVTSIPVRAEPPSVLGTWKGSGQSMNYRGEIERFRLTLKIENQTGNLIAGSMVLTATGVMFSDAPAGYIKHDGSIGLRLGQTPLTGSLSDSNTRMSLYGIDALALKSFCFRLRKTIAP